MVVGCVQVEPLLKSIAVTVMQAWEFREVGLERLVCSHTNQILVLERVGVRKCLGKLAENAVSPSGGEEMCNHSDFGEGPCDDTCIT